MLPLQDLPEFPYDFLALRDSYLANEPQLMAALLPQASLTAELSLATSTLAGQLIQQARQAPPQAFNDFLQHYRLDSQEGRILLTLAEALLRIPDSRTRNDLINSLLPQAHWQLDSPAETKSRWVQWAGRALNLAQRFVREESFPDAWHQMLLKLGDSVLRPAMVTGINLMAKQFVMAETLPTALSLRESGFRYSFDCLGEAAQTPAEAENYYRSYQQALEQLATQPQVGDLLARDSISIKLSALHPRYEARNWPQLQQDLLPKLTTLCRFAAEAGIPITFDAEESERLELSLALFGSLLAQPELRYGGLGLAVQAYQKRAPAVLAWLQQQAENHHVRIPVRLVKGAYWDSEIKRAQQLGLADYPVYSRKLHTDVSYLACARMLLQHPEHFYPQFASHNAYTLAWLETVARHYGQDYEVQRLVGMGEAVHVAFQQHSQRPIRLYAPIGEFNTLLPYLVRRLLENGSSQSFVNQLANNHIDYEHLCRDPVAELTQKPLSSHPRVPKPVDLFAPRENSAGWNWADIRHMEHLREQLLPWHNHTWKAGNFKTSPLTDHVVANNRHSPTDKHLILGTVHWDGIAEVNKAYEQAQHGFWLWQQEVVSQRANCLRRMADQLTHHQSEILYLLCYEAGKTLPDALGEWREAIDLCRYYADEAERLQSRHALPSITGESNHLELAPRGVFLCISPWNFPLAIFLGQIVAALVTGNTVVAKAANQTPLIARRAVELLYQSGIPEDALQLVIGSSSELGVPLLQHPALSGVVFTGSTRTGRHLAQQLANREGALLPLIAETGGLNAMIADSSALPEQLVQDVLMSAFNSAGQRCSALRILWLQADLKEAVLSRLAGALSQWRVGHPVLLNSDVGPVIDGVSQAELVHYSEHLQKLAQWSTQATLPTDHGKGYYIAPLACLLRREDLPNEEIFGPILHIALWEHDELPEVVELINRSGYGLTLGVHSRISSHIDYIRRYARVGNVYINRNQIGAVVGCQPFGGEGLSGTGFKAGGPHYLLRFCTERTVTDNLAAIGGNTQLMNLD